MAVGNAINEQTTGICGFTGTAFTGSPATQYTVQVGGATSSTLASVGPGSSGQVLQSGGGAANPAYSTATYPAIATGTGKILRADGTNWVASTATYPDTAGTTGNVLTSDGTNWSSVAQSFLFAQVNISSVDFKNSSSVPIPIVSNPGAGKIIMVHNAVFKLNYAGSNVFTAGGVSQIIYTTAGTVLWALVSTSNYTGSVDKVYSMLLAVNANAVLAEDNGISYKSGSSNPAGNAANDNTVSVGVWYSIVTLT